MIITLTKEDYIYSITPFYNGCDFRILIKENELYIDSGCYVLYRLLTGCKKHLWDLYLKNGSVPFKIEVSEEIKKELLKIKPCKRCKGTEIPEGFKEVE